MTDVADLPGASQSFRSRDDLLVIVGFCVLALVVCFLAALYVGPASYIPVDPAAIGHFA